MSAMIITGCWEGALRSDQSGQSLPFAMQQIPVAPTSASAMRLRIGNHYNAPARLLDGASHSMVALIDAGDTVPGSPADGSEGQWLVDARVRGDRLIGRWVRRDTEGHILGTGQLSAAKIATRSNTE